MEHLENPVVLTLIVIIVILLIIIIIQQYCIEQNLKDWEEIIKDFEKEKLTDIYDGND